METNQTLHDFVLNLLIDADARASFDLDPEGALRAAGLHDITAADVQDVVPLVVDYAPVQGLTSLTPAAVGVDQLPVDSADVVGQLQNVTQQFAVAGSANGVDVKAGVLGTIAVDPTTVSAGASVLPGIGLGIGRDGLDTDLTGVGDVAHTLDADVVGGLDSAVEPVTRDVVDTTTGVAGDPLGTGDSLVGGGLDGVLPNTQGHVGGLVDSLGVNDTLGGLGVGHPVQDLDVTGAVTGVTSHVDSTVSGTLGGVNGTVSGLTGGVSGSASVHGEAHASADAGLLGLGDGLF
ncbi:IniB N-terminal domain-containing protein [Micromonospora sp. KC606]|uniref:IniB N-terminal domain-containing protein n=1 Tax=Micromonospora sp. KC606 TaxID=2530379 RepID=UPI001404C28C|nr:IniB N-terminal domain-containing protein [Micromonospora sp. KC606]